MSNAGATGTRHGAGHGAGNDTADGWDEYPGSPAMHGALGLNATSFSPVYSRRAGTNVAEMGDGEHEVAGDTGDPNGELGMPCGVLGVWNEM